MGWQSKKTEVVQNPQLKAAHMAPYKDRGIKFLKALWRKSQEDFQLRLAVGPAYDADHKPIGGFVSVDFGEYDPIVFFSQEMDHLIVFLRQLPDRLKARYDAEEPGNFDRFVQLIQEAANQAKTFEQRH